MKLKMTMAAVAVAMASFAGQASADVANAGTGDGELVFQIWDATAGAESSYTRDLGVKLSSFLTGVAAGNSWSYLADATFTTWYNGLSAAAQSNLKWNVAAGDKSGAHTYITTAPVTFDNFVGNTSFTHAQARNMGLGMDVYLGGVNTAMPGTAVADNLSVTITGKANTGYAGNFGGNWGNYMNLVSTATTVGNYLNLYKITAVSSGSSAVAAPWTQLKSGANDYTATFGADGTLSIAAVPEADTWAMLLAGLGLMGFIARRRTAV